MTSLTLVILILQVTRSARALKYGDIQGNPIFLFLWLKIVFVPFSPLYVYKQKKIKNKNM